MAASTEAPIAEFASAPTPLSPPPSSLSPWSSPLPQIPSSPLLLPSPPTHTSPTYADAPLGYRAAMIQSRATSLPPIPSPPFLLPSADRRSDILETNVPFQKRLCLTALGSRVDYGFINTVDASIQASESRVMTAVEEVIKRVTDLATIQRQDAHELHMRDEDAQDDQALLRAQISILTRERRYFLSMAFSYEREVVISRQAWSRSKDKSTALEASIRTLEAQKIPPKKTTTTPMTDATTKALIAQGVADALANFKAHRSSGNGDDSHDSGSGRRTERAARECTYSDFLKCQPLNFKGTKGVVGLTQWFEKMEYCSDVVKFPRQDRCHDATYGMTWKTLRRMMTDKMFPEEYDEVEKYVGRFPDIIQSSVMTSKPKTMQDAIEFATELMDQKIYTFADGQVENKRKLDNNSKNNQTQQQPFKRQNVARAYIVGPGEKKESFVSTAFSSLIDIVPTTLDHDYDVELADEKIIRVNTIIRGCTLDFLNHSFNIDLIPIELGSFDIIIRVDWLVKYHAVIVCDEKIVRIPFVNEILIVYGDGSNNGHESRLNIIWCQKTQMYFLKGYNVFLVHITTKKAKDTSNEKRLKDIPIVRDFPEAPYRLASFERKELSNQLQKLSDKDFIRPSSSTWGDPVLFVKKNDGSFQMCIDYQELNKPTVKNRHLLLRIDDFIRSTSRSKQEHEDNLKLILELLKKEELYAKFFLSVIPKVQFLGHVIDNKGIHVDPAKIESIKDWASPKTPTEIRQFLGLVVTIEDSLKHSQRSPSQ
uniref:Putative reverse transcriptase domain-containing protein n=1 Tax=Tanacetum cinerariifolium TaxID=118510 RepID=A0A699GNG4_TANCI|nr:putative reverse transcriptase domain-containing protein [Tanacetum cinerariifolium]